MFADLWLCGAHLIFLAANSYRVVGCSLIAAKEGGLGIKTKGECILEGGGCVVYSVMDWSPVARSPSAVMMRPCGVRCRKPFCMR